MKMLATVLLGLCLGVAWAEEVVRVRPLDAAIGVFDADQVRSLRGVSADVKAVHLDYLNDVADVINSYYLQVKTMGLEPIDFISLTNGEDPGLYLLAMTERCQVAVELVDKGIELCHASLSESLRRIRATGKYSDGLREEFRDFSIWALILFEYEEISIVEKRQVLDALYESFGFWEVDGDSIVFYDGADYGHVSAVETHLKRLKNLESVNNRWDLRAKMRVMDPLESDDCWADIMNAVDRDF
jgi:hypothetical protein